MGIIIFQFIGWYFIDTSKDILRGWRNFLKFNLEFFSTIMLLKTFFSPWRRYQWVFPRGFDVGKYAEVIVSNLVSRVLGAIVRSVLIVVGLSMEVVVFFTGLFVFIAWLVLPAVLIFGFIFGFKQIFF